MDNGMVDVRGRIQEIESELLGLNETISSAQFRIEKYQQTIAQSEAKASELRNVIVIFKKYLLGEAESDVKGVGEARVENTSQRLNLPEAIQKILDSSPSKEFTVADVAETLIKQGYPTKSADFKNVVRNTMSRMGSEGQIKVREDGLGQTKKYWSLYQNTIAGMTLPES
ncbi:MAG: hypothetical protein HZA20_09175 [Nitrospirae bacterium]|nr:hypothetical protein [Nitrospirota bacterium]